MKQGFTHDLGIGLTSAVRTSTTASQGARE
jgi:hypothetical protein